jgi:hypothetical protein
VKEVQKQQITLAKSLFDDLILNIKVSDLSQEVTRRTTRMQESIRKFRLRNFTYANEVDDDWMTLRIHQLRTHQSE